MKSLRHPREDFDCETEGLTLDQATERGRVFLETFFVCRSCGRSGEIIERCSAHENQPPLKPFSMATMIKAAVVIGIPLAGAAAWFRTWNLAAWAAVVIVTLPLVAWNENRKWNAELIKRGLPRADAPGRVPVSPPTRGCARDEDIIVGRRVGGLILPPAGTGDCCDRPNWKWAGCERDEDRIPCYACGRGVMTVSESAIH